MKLAPLAALWIVMVYFRIFGFSIHSLEMKLVKLGHFSQDLRQGTQCFVLRMDPKVGCTGSRGKVPSMGPKVGSLGWGTKLGFKA